MEKRKARRITPRASTQAVKMTKPRYHRLCATETSPVIVGSDDGFVVVDSTRNHDVVIVVVVVVLVLAAILEVFVL